MGSEDDPLVEELVRARRDRQVIAIAVGVGIVFSAVLGLGAALGAVHGTERDHAALVFFVMPLVLSLAVGYGLYWLRRRRKG